MAWSPLRAAPLLACVASALRRTDHAVSDTLLGANSRFAQTPTVGYDQERRVVSGLPPGAEVDFKGGRWSPQGWLIHPTQNRTTYVDIHIPKTAGCSFALDAAKLLPPGVGYWSKETCYRGSGPNLTGPARWMAMFREPTAHVYSQFMECKYDPWFQSIIPFFGKRFPRVTDWLKHFQGGSQFNDFDCYHPYNMQARALSCSDDKPKASHHMKRDEHLEDAVALVDGLFFVGVVEHYQTSVCLFHAKSHARQTPLPPFCNCRNESAWRSFGGSHESHGIPAHSLDDLELQDHRMIDNLTKVDQQVYSLAKQRFLKDVRTVERDKGVQILC